MSTQNRDASKMPRDPDLVGAEAALHRAARRARQRANIFAKVREAGGFDPRQLSFSQAQGYEEIPGPLKLEELSQDARTRIWNLLYDYLQGSAKTNVFRVVAGGWERILINMHCDFDNLARDDWESLFSTVRTSLRVKIENDPFNRVFDRVQFIMRHGACPPNFVSDMKRVFEDCGLAYAIDEGPPPTILPVSTPEEGTALLQSLRSLRDAGFVGSTSHLQEASECINRGDWVGGIRESIHAVESVARKIDPKSSRTLTDALKSIEKQGALHTGLREAFAKLYGYTSDEQGIRHALLDSSTANVSIDEAVFMLGACASFASYLSRKYAAGAKA